MTEQLGFGFEQIAEEQRTAYLPAAIEEAVPYYRGLLEKYHAAILTGDEAAAKKINDEAHDLAVKLNGGRMGILAPDGAGTKLELATTAEPGIVPLWGQAGEFAITVGNMKVRIEQDGMFGLGCSVYPGFSAHVVEYDKPFLSETGYRSFIGCMSEVAPGRTPNSVAQDMCEAYIREQSKGKLKKISQGHVEREMERRKEPARPQRL